MCGILLMQMRPGRNAEDGVRGLLSMQYRGKDGKMGYQEAHGWFMGHVRLAIQDLSDESSQPFSYYNGDFFSFVGEVFDHKGPTELEYIAKRYIQKGPTSFLDYDGFWAGSFLSSRGLDVWTDHLSIKPLYYWESEGIVCSELEPMFNIAPRPEPDLLYLSNTIKFGYTHTGQTPYQGIMQLPPGTWMNLGSQSRVVKQYYNWGFVEVPQEPKPLDLRFALVEATLNRLVGDREVSVLLSGGLDSTIIYSILKRHNIERKVFSIENGESMYLPESCHMLTPMPEALDLALWAHQVPVDLGSMVPQYQLGQVLEEQKVNVCLSGDGADELFGGYRRSQEYDSQISDIFSELPYYHLPRLDRLMMRHTVELRSPYLAPKVVAIAMRVPYAQRTEKQFLKEAFKDIVPRHILERKKHPLKTKEVIEGGVQYRRGLVNKFLEYHYGNKQPARL